MELSEQDARVVRFVSQFRQASTRHIAYVCFDGISAVTVGDHLKRLLDRKYLARVGRRATGERGGAGAYVYQLGPRGWWFVQREGRYWPYRSINQHALKVADLFVSFLEAERGGRLKILYFALEQVVTPTIRADVYMEVGVHALNRRFSLYVEVDLGTERPRLITAKLDGYWDAYTSSSAETFPYVVFAVPDGWRASEIERIIERRPEEQGELFRIIEADGFIDQLLQSYQ